MKNKILTTIILAAAIMVSTVACGKNVEVENTEVIENASTVEKVGDEVLTAKADSEEKEDEIIEDDFTTVNSTSDVAVKKNESTVSANSGNTSSNKTSNESTVSANSGNTSSNKTSNENTTASDNTPQEVNNNVNTSWTGEIEAAPTPIGYAYNSGWTGTVWFSNDDVRVIHDTSLDNLLARGDAMRLQYANEHGLDPQNVHYGWGCDDYGEDRCAEFGIDYNSPVYFEDDFYGNFYHLN